MDAPGLLHHIIARGIERRDIFHDFGEYKDFLDRVPISLEKSPNSILAWALMPNHFHLLVRSGQGGISDLMRRLMTGYAVAFNLRHERVGHLFQNRFKSVVCDENVYLLELVRYIHLNPVRAGIVKSLGDLRRYPWTGHAALMGTISRPWQNTEEILIHFSDTTSAAREKYERFLGDDKENRLRPDLPGGGLFRSAGGRANALGPSPEGLSELSDERILGAGAFVESVIGKFSARGSSNNKPIRLSLEDLSRRVAEMTGVDAENLHAKGRTARVSCAKAILIFAATSLLGRSVQESAEWTKMSGPAASKAVGRGRSLLSEEELAKLVT